MGLGYWRVATSLISGFLAKESVVALMGMLYGGTAAMTASIPTASAVALLVFCLLYTPCVAAIAAIKRELGIKWALGIVVFLLCGYYLNSIIGFVVYIVAITLLCLLLARNAFVETMNMGVEMVRSKLKKHR